MTGLRVTFDKDVSTKAGYCALRARLAALSALVIVSLASALMHPAEAEDKSLVLENRIPLENVAGRIDHLAVDLRHHRLFVAELGNNSVDVIDLVTGKILHRIDGLKEPQGLGYLPDRDLLAVANGGDGSLRFFHAMDWSRAATIELGEDADNIRLDPRSGQVVVGYGNGALGVIDPASLRKVGEIKLPAHPEGFRLDPAAGLAFVNIPDAELVAVANLKSRQVVAAWKMAPLSGHFPMALDHPGGDLAIVFRHPATLALVDSKTGAILKSLPTCGDADDVFFDEKRQRIYISCGAGEIDVKQRDAATIRDKETIPTVKGARTSLFVPELDRLFVAARAEGQSGAAILVFRPMP